MFNLDLRVKVQNWFERVSPNFGLKLSEAEVKIWSIERKSRSIFWTNGVKSGRSIFGLVTIVYQVETIVSANIGLAVCVCVRWAHTSV